MNYHHQLGPPLTLAERLAQLNDNLQSLGDQLKEAIARAIGTTVSDAVRDAIRGLLGDPECPASYQTRDWREEDRSWRERSWDDPMHDHWMDRSEMDTEDRQRHRRTTTARLNQAIGAALQTSLWWLREQKSRRPILTTGAVALAAGVAAFFYGPALAAGVGLLASVAGMVLTAESANSAAERLAVVITD